MIPRIYIQENSLSDESKTYDLVIEDDFCGRETVVAMVDRASAEAALEALRNTASHRIVEPAY